MPIEIHKNVAEMSVTDIDKLILENGSLTLIGQVLTAFLESVEFDDLIDDADVKEFVEVEEAAVKSVQGSDDLEVVEADADGSELCLIETLPGDVAEAFIDIDDLVNMFEHFVTHMEETTTQDRILKAAALELLGEGYDLKNLEEASVFKKGDFRKIRSGTLKTPNGKTGPELINRMLGAMLKKEAIKRAKAPGAGYKRGDYDKNPAGYGGGTGKGRKAVMMFKNKNKSSLAVKAKRVKGGAGAEAKLKAKATADKAKAKAKAAGLKKSKGTMTKAGGKQKDVASDTNSPAANIVESADLAVNSLGRAASMVANINNKFHVK